MKTITEVSRETGIPRSTIATAVDERRLAAQKIGTQWVIDEQGEDFKSFLARHKPKARKSSATSQK